MKGFSRRASTHDLSGTSGPGLTARLGYSMSSFLQPIDAERNLKAIHFLSKEPGDVYKPFLDGTCAHLVGHVIGSSQGFPRGFLVTEPCPLDHATEPVHSVLTSVLYNSGHPSQSQGNF